MRRSLRIVVFSSCLFLLTSCIKELSFESKLPTAPASGGSAVYTLSVGGNDCMNANVSGSYTQGTAPGPGNTVNIEVNVATVGTWTMNSSPAAGFYFSGSGTFASTGVQSITLTASGTPNASGDQTFTLSAGGVSCSFVVPVAPQSGGGTTPPGNTGEYFPLTANSWWSYDDPLGSPGDTILTTNIGSITLGGKSYQQFKSSDDAGPYDTSYYRKDNSGSYYMYQKTDELEANGFPITFTQPGLDILFLKNSLKTNDTWVSDFIGTAQGLQVVFRLKCTCVDANASLTLNGNTYNNVYQVRTQPQIGFAGTFTDAGPYTDQYFAKGVGMIQFDDQGELQTIRYWKVF